MSNWDNGAYFDDDTWLQPVTYDQTDYRGVDAYLEPDARPSHAPADRTGTGSADDCGWDEYAGYDELGYLGSEPAPLATDSWQQLPQLGEAWAPGTDPHGEPWRPDVPRRPRRPRRLLVGICAVAAAALGFSVVIVTHTGNRSLPSSTLPSGTVSPASTSVAPASPATAWQPPVTQSQARHVLAAYTAANNTANAQASQSLLAGVETGGSLAIDAGIYAAQRASHAAGYPAFGPVAASYYIPLESPAAYPHWFAVRVTNALLRGSSRSGAVINAEYLVFTQAAAGAPWRNAIEPFVLTPVAMASIALNVSGYATAVPPSDTSLALSPATASAATATAIESGAGQPADPGNLADKEELMSLRKAISPHSSITSSHSATTDSVFGLRTTDGGALLFYDVAARLTISAAPGGTLRLDIPGIASPGSPVTEVALDYLEQFAVNDPPAGHGMAARVIADYSGLVGSAG